MHRRVKQGEIEKSEVACSQGGVHFQLAGFPSPSGVKTFFKPEEVPPALLRVIREDTRQDLFPEPVAVK